MTTSSRILLAVAVAVHILFIISLVFFPTTPEEEPEPTPTLVLDDNISQKQEEIAPEVDPMNPPTLLTVPWDDTLPIAFPVE